MSRPGQPQLRVRADVQNQLPVGALLQVRGQVGFDQRARQQGAVDAGVLNLNRVPVVDQLGRIQQLRFFQQALVELRRVDPFVPFQGVQRHVSVEVSLVDAGRRPHQLFQISNVNRSGPALEFGRIFIQRRCLRHSLRRRLRCIRGLRSLGRRAHWWQVPQLEQAHPTRHRPQMPESIPTQELTISTCASNRLQITIYVEIIEV